DTVAWWRNADVKGAMFSVSPFVTRVECVPEEGKALRLQPEAFGPGDFHDNDRYQVVQPWGWYQARTPADIAAVSNAYFTQGLATVEAPEAPKCELLIENHYLD